MCKPPAVKAKSANREIGVPRRHPGLFLPAKNGIEVSGEVGSFDSQPAGSRYSRSPGHPPTKPQVSFKASATRRSGLSHALAF